ncbi:hypothetical protein LTR85_006655 [Meristemomyces frigidus]|nr:hypothetical protein LTR85_006655 [Meristemomyces frigidus]
MPSFNSASIATEVTVDAPPAKVREVLLAFEDGPKWTHRFIQGLAVRRAGTGEAISAFEAKPGDVVKLKTAQAGTSDAVMEINTPEKFGWRGGSMGFVAHHWFDILPSPEGEGKTLFKHSETFDGGVAFLFMAYSPLRGWLEGLYKTFNEDLKKAVEGVEEG